MHPPTILDIELLEGRVKNRNFAVCLAHNGGQLSFGNMNDSLHVGDSDKGVIDCSGADWRTQYHTSITNVKVGDTGLSYDFAKINQLGGLSSFDTGSTFVYLPFDMHTAFVEQFNRYCNSESGNCGGQKSFINCFKYDEQDHGSLEAFFNTFPVITFIFKGDAEYKWYPSDYLSTPKDSSVVHCAVVKPYSKVILGATFMRNYDIQFDQTDKKIRFARANCGLGAGSPDPGNVFYTYDHQRVKAGGQKLDMTQTVSDAGYRFLVIYSGGVVLAVLVSFLCSRDRLN